MNPAPGTVISVLPADHILRASISSSFSLERRPFSRTRIKRSALFQRFPGDFFRSWYAIHGTSAFIHAVLTSSCSAPRWQYPSITCVCGFHPVISISTDQRSNGQLQAQKHSAPAVPLRKPCYRQVISDHLRYLVHILRYYGIDLPGHY